MWVVYLSDLLLNNGLFSLENAQRINYFVRNYEWFAAHLFMFLTWFGLFCGFSYQAILRCERISKCWLTQLAHILWLSISSINTIHYNIIHSSKLHFSNFSTVKLKLWFQKMNIPFERNWKMVLFELYHLFQSYLNLLFFFRSSTSQKLIHFQRCWTIQHFQHIDVKNNLVNLFASQNGKWSIIHFWYIWQMRLHFSDSIDGISMCHNKQM